LLLRAVIIHRLNKALRKRRNKRKDSETGKKEAENMIFLIKEQ